MLQFRKRARHEPDDALKPSSKLRYGTTNSCSPLVQAIDWRADQFGILLELCPVGRDGRDDVVVRRRLTGPDELTSERVAQNDRGILG